MLARNVRDVAAEMLEFFPGIIIEGARQVGKITLARQLADPDAMVVSLDDEQVRAQARDSPQTFVRSSGGRQMVIDEIQRMPELTLAIKSEIDADRRPGRVILTGSASLLRVRGLADSLAGRVGRLSLFGFSRGEVAGKKEDFVTRVVDASASLTLLESGRPRNDYAGILVAGAYPELQSVGSRLRRRWIDSYLRGIVDRDLSELRRQLEPSRVMSILKIIAARPSAELVKSKLAGEASVAPNTVTAYLDLLHEVSLIASLPPWTPNIAKREVRRPKTFVIDSGLAMRLNGLSETHLVQLTYSEAFGGLLEAYVAAELLRQREWSESSFDLYHYRDRGGAEVDLIIELEGGAVIGIEVKAASSFTARHFANLKTMRDKLGERFVAGIVLNTGERGYQFSDRLYSAPISALWEFGI